MKRTTTTFLWLTYHTYEFILFFTVFYLYLKSHVIGEGAVIEKLGFNPKGKSVLINQYKQMYGLHEPGTEMGMKITRSEIMQNPP